MPFWINVIKFTLILVKKLFNYFQELNIDRLNLIYGNSLILAKHYLSVQILRLLRLFFSFLANQ